MDPRRQRAFLQQFCKLYPQVAYAHTIGPDGISVARADDKPPMDYRDREYFRRVMAGAPFARETLLRSRSTGHAAINQAAPILDPARQGLGSCGGGHGFGRVGRRRGRARYGRSGYSCVLDEQGRTLAHPDLTCASTLQDLHGLPPVRGVLRERVSRSYRFQDEQGVRWLAYAVPLANGWSVISFKEEAEVLAQAHQVLALGMLVMGVVAMVMISLIWLAIMMMVRPIVRMTDAAMRIADGDWKQRIPEDRKDELGTLAKAFNKMVGQLGSTYRSVEDKVAQLSAALAERQAVGGATHQAFAGRRAKPGDGGDHRSVRRHRIRQSAIHQGDGLRRGRSDRTILQRPQVRRPPARVLQEDVGGRSRRPGMAWGTLQPEKGRHAVLGADVHLADSQCPRRRCEFPRD